MSLWGYGPSVSRHATTQVQLIRIFFWEPVITYFSTPLQYTSNGKPLKEKSQLTQAAEIQSIYWKKTQKKQKAYPWVLFTLCKFSWGWLTLSMSKKINGSCSVFNSPSWFYHCFSWLPWRFLITFDLNFGLGKNKLSDGIAPFCRWHRCCLLSSWENGYFGFPIFALISLAVDFSFASSFKLTVLRYDNSQNKTWYILQFKTILSRSFLGFYLQFSTAWKMKREKENMENSCITN